MSGEKYFFISNVRINGEVTAQMLGYDTPTEAEIKFHDEVSYVLKRNDVELARYEVRNEHGVIYDNLIKVIDNAAKE